MSILSRVLRPALRGELAAEGGVNKPAGDKDAAPVASPYTRHPKM